MHSEQKYFIRCMHLKWPVKACNIRVLYLKIFRRYVILEALLSVSLKMYFIDMMLRENLQ